MNQPFPDSRPVTLADLEREGRLVWCYCLDCCREREVPPSSLGLPPQTPVPRVRERLVCSACGSRRIDTRPQLHPTPIADLRRKGGPQDSEVDRCEGDEAGERRDAPAGPKR